MRKRIIAALLAMTMVCTMAVGCGSTKSDEVADSTSPQVSEENTGKGETLEPVELTWYYRAESMPDQDQVFEKANEIIKEKINATVNFVPIAPSDYEQKMQTYYASGSAGDINFTSSWTNKYVQNVSKGAYLEMTEEMLEKYAPGVYEFFTEDQWNALRVNGKIYGIPNAQIFAKSTPLTVRKDLAEKYSLDIASVKSLSDLTPFMEQVNQKEGMIFERYGLSSGFVNLIYAYGFDDISAYAYVKADDPELKVLNPYATEEFAAYCAESKEWADKGYIANDAMVKQDMEAEMNAGKIAARARGTYKPGIEIAEVSANWTPGTELVATMLGENAILTTSGITSTICSIPATSKNPERALMLLDLMNTNTELYNLICYGIEGVHYEVVGENTIKQIATDKYKGIPWMMGNTFNAYVLEGSSANLNEATIELNNTALASEALGFSFDAEPVKTQIAQVQTVIDEYLPALNCGAVDNVEEALAKFNEKLVSAGMDEIVAEAQSQIDAWKATK